MLRKSSAGKVIQHWMPRLGMLGDALMRPAIFGVLALVVLSCSATVPLFRKPVSAVDELYHRSVSDLERGLYPEAVKGFGLVKTKFPYSEYAALSDLKLGDVYFAQGQHLEAADQFRHFLRLYPTHPEAGYAMFQIGEAYYEQIPNDFFILPPSSEKDSANVRLARSAFSDMLARFPEHEKAALAKTRTKDCRARLARHEMYVAKFYFKQDRFEASARRSEGLLELYSGLGFDKKALWIAGKSRAELGEHDLALQLLNRLRAEFPKSREASKANSLISGLGASTLRPEGSPNEK